MMENYLPGMPGDHPNWKNAVSMNSMSSGIDFSIFDYADELKVPKYMVYGTEAVSKGGAIRLYDQLTSLKERLVIEGAGHFDLYWKPEYVDPAVNGITDFLRKQISIR
jgi:fermentation-respiration switch protein FrsA (DUF1100 family)